MTKKDFLKTWKCPLPEAILKKYPAGNIIQFWAESPNLYSGVYGRTDDLGRFTAGHNGIDIKTFHRDPVRAPFDGKVYGIVESRTSLGGVQVYIDSPVLDDDGKKIVIMSGFAHLDEVSVKTWQDVKCGDIIGYEGNTGFVISGNTPYWGNAPVGRGTHLHWLVRELLITDSQTERKNRYTNSMGGTIDPLYYLNGDTNGNLVYLSNIGNFLRYLKLKFFK